MKFRQLVLLPAFTYSAKTRPGCTTAPAKLTPGSSFSCPAGSSWNHGDICTVSGDGCTGQVKCHKGNWRGRPVCPKTCEGTPENPTVGGTWSCSTSHHSSCVFTVASGYTCINNVLCNEKHGVWRRKPKCRYTGNYNTCTCSNGTPVTDQNCVTNGSNQCASCDNGFELNNGVCQPEKDIHVTLTWNCLVDLDLSVVDPTGEQVGWYNTQSVSGGSLDLDDEALEGNGPFVETISWASAPSGEYNIIVNHYNEQQEGCVGQTFSVKTVLKGVESEYSGLIPEESVPTFVTNFNFDSGNRAVFRLYKGPKFDYNAPKKVKN